MSLNRPRKILRTACVIKAKKLTTYSNLNVYIVDKIIYQQFFFLLMIKKLLISFSKIFCSFYLFAQNKTLIASFVFLHIFWNSPKSNTVQEWNITRDEQKMVQFSKIIMYALPSASCYVQYNVLFFVFPSSPFLALGFSKFDFGFLNRIGEIFEKNNFFSRFCV